MLVLNIIATTYKAIPNYNTSRITVEIVKNTMKQLFFSDIILENIDTFVEIFLAELYRYNHEIIEPNFHKYKMPRIPVKLYINLDEMLLNIEFRDYTKNGDVKIEDFNAYNEIINLVYSTTKYSKLNYFSYIFSFKITDIRLINALKEIKKTLNNNGGDK